MAAVFPTALSRMAAMLLCVGLPCAAVAETVLHEGELNGAPFKVAVPAEWQAGRAFFHVHG